MFTPSKPLIFFGRDEVVNACINELLGPKHVALIGTGGMGKSTIAKAVLNEERISSKFTARLFVTYDDIVSSAMTYQLFMNRIAEALGLPASTATPAVIQHLQTLTGLLVIDNAETFLEASQNDTSLIHKFLEEIGSHATTRVIMTTRNTETVSLNLPWHRIDVTGLDAKAAHEAFNAVYPMSPMDSRVAQILSDLGHHPLSINLLANVAVMNDWDATLLQAEWDEGKTKLLDLTKSDKARSLPATIDISIASFKKSPAVLQILQTIAFLPQGIDREDMSSMFPSIPDISSQVEAIRRSSLIYRNGKRLTMLPPVRMYISEEYNSHLPYDSPVLSDVRAHYHSKLSDEAHGFVEREHGNIDHLMHFDMSSELYRSDVDTHVHVLMKTRHFLFCTSEVVQRTSLWPLLVSETVESSFSQVDALAKLISLCLTHICWQDYQRHQDNEALLKLDVVEKYCRGHRPVCDQQLVRCLRLRGAICHNIGNLVVAANALQEASTIAHSIGDLLDGALLDDSLADVLLSQGKVTEAKHLLTSAQKYYESNNHHYHLIILLLSQGYLAISQNDFNNARTYLSKSMELDRENNGERRRLRILNYKASCEGSTGDFTTAKMILEEATKVEIASDSPQFHYYMHAMRGKAYYEARLAKLDDARRTIAHAIELQRSSGGDWLNTFMSACIELFSDGGQHTAESIFQTIVDQDEGSRKSYTVIYRRTLGEVMILDGKAFEAKAQFEKAKAICDENGMSPTHLYVSMLHWYSLPEKYDGWACYLDSQS